MNRLKNGTMLPALFLSLVVVTSMLTFPLAKPNNNNGNGYGTLQPGIDFNGPHYTLNIIGKKSTWGGQGGSFDNWDRHTMFVPINTTSYVYTPNGTLVGRGITIWMQQDPAIGEFAVIDGNAFDDDQCRLNLAPGKYRVYIVAKAKNPKWPGEPVTDITGWVWYYNATGAYEYFFDIGEVHVKKSRKWYNATDLFYVSPQESQGSAIEVSTDTWVFDYLAMLKALEDITDAAYFWQYDNHGNKLVQVRFYPI